MEPKVREELQVLRVLKATQGQEALMEFKVLMALQVLQESQALQVPQGLRDLRSNG